MIFQLSTTSEELVSKGEKNDMNPSTFPSSPTFYSEFAITMLLIVVFHRTNCLSPQSLLRVNT